MDRTGKTIVAKFGGSSVGDAAKIRACAARVAAMVRAGHRVAVVVSAMGDTTDELLELAAEVATEPSRRELDQLLSTGEIVSVSLVAMALQGMGIDGVSLSGQQCGIQTDAQHTRARISGIDGTRLEREWIAGRVPVIAGFQGVHTHDDGRVDVTTLGRGGSDTTAVAIAAAVKADECLIFTDVAGVYTADPRLVPDARLIEEISYDEMMEAASQGAKVMHLRAVELARKHGVPIRVLHSHQDSPGTLIGTRSARAEDGAGPPVSTVAIKTDIGRVTLSNLPNRAGLQKQVFEAMGAIGLMVDDIIQTENGRAGLVENLDPPAPAEGGNAPGPSISDLATIVFTVDRSDLHEVRPAIERALAEIGQGELRIDLGLAKVSAVGAGMQSQSGVAATLFAAMGEAGIRIANITTSEIKISCIVDERDAKPALRAVHHAFGLHLEPVVVQKFSDRPIRPMAS